MDQPYNLLPSLHIALRTILAETYARHTRGVLRHASNIWFVLIGLSALLFGESWNGLALKVVIVALAILTNLTAIQRIVWVYQHARGVPLDDQN